ncbi:L-threonine O-3-phosphate decarboxylase [Breoghania corrubedonensis]|uniref:threonine-phosphate decarboxylase n=1 Tax=Breoghania corrubedonensis TaxID=665038 RepID=A0A2T5V9H1_9HYPH|nr:threonine-phosphate decarboxylase CobD [Breoghania corrubedonensis]PTW60384.1 L-threonine O-3-phosphate decarboxylase [Breoghania corrubedonensis]
MKHGGNLALAVARYGGVTNDWLDLSTGINPHAWGDGSYANLLVENDWMRLPDTTSGEALIAAARTAYAACETLTFAATPGTQAALSMLARLAPAGDAAIVSPTYTGHREAWHAAGRSLREVENLDEAGDATTVILVNPNNPDGRVLSAETLLAFARKLAARGGLLIVDEAFADVAPQTSLLPYLRDEPVAVLRSFGKFFGLAGLRLGFVVAQSPLVRAVEANFGSWAVSGPALAIGRAALSDQDWQQRMRERLGKEAAALDAVLGKVGLPVSGGTALFRLLVHADAITLHESLARRHILTRHFDEHPTWLRVGLPGSKEALERLAEALAAASPVTAD